MSSPYEELIAALQLLKGSLETPIGMMEMTAQADQLQEAMEAKAALEQSLGMIPIPADHPDFIAVAGALGEALGMVDEVNVAYQQVRQAASTAQAAVQNASMVIESVIMGMQQGHQ